jgi:hypothetical protein
MFGFLYGFPHKPVDVKVFHLVFLINGITLFFLSMQCESSSPSDEVP